MADDYGILGYILRHALVSRALNDRFVGGSTKRVGYHFDENFIFSNFREFKLFDTQVVGAVKPHSFCKHFNYLT